MAKFISIPTEIEAEQFIPEKPPWPEGIIESKGVGESPSRFFVKDSEQNNASIPVNSGDWIVTGTQGEKYPCSDRVFKQKYRSKD